MEEEEKQVACEDFGLPLASEFLASDEAKVAKVKRDLEAERMKIARQLIHAVRVALEGAVASNFVAGKVVLELSEGEYLALSPDQPPCDLFNTAVTGAGYAWEMDEKTGRNDAVRTWILTVAPAAKGGGSGG